MLSRIWLVSLLCLLPLKARAEAGFYEMDQTAPAPIAGAAASVFGVQVLAGGTGTTELVGKKMIAGQSYLVFMTASHVVASCAQDEPCKAITLFKNARVEACISENKMTQYYEDQCKDADVLFDIPHKDRQNPKFIQVKAGQAVVQKVDKARDLALFVVPEASLLDYKGKPVTTDQAQVKALSMPASCEEKAGERLYADGFPATFMRTSWTEDSKEHSRNGPYITERWSKGVEIESRYCYWVNSAGNITSEKQPGNPHCMTEKEFQVAAWSSVDPQKVTSCPPPQPFIRNYTTVDAITGSSGGVTVNSKGEFVGLMQSAAVDHISAAKIAAAKPSAAGDSSSQAQSPCQATCDGVYAYPKVSQVTAPSVASTANGRGPYNEYKGQEGDGSNPDSMKLQSVLTGCEETKKFVSDFLAQK